MKPKELIKLLEKDGWKLSRVNSSHHIFKKVGCKRPIVVPIHNINKDVSIGTLKNILREANLRW